MRYGTAPYRSMDNQPEMVRLMPFLERVAKEFGTVIEIGVGHGNGSMRAFYWGLMSRANTNQLMEKAQKVIHTPQPLHVMVDLDESRPTEYPYFNYAWRPVFHAVVHGDSRDESTREKVENVRKTHSVVSGLREEAYNHPLIYIDTDHTYEQMKRELEVWGGLKVPADGQLPLWLFHDTWMLGEYNPMTDAIKEYAENVAGHEYVDVTRESHGLGALVSSKEEKEWVVGLWEEVEEKYWKNDPPSWMLSGR